MPQRDSQPEYQQTHESEIHLKALFDLMPDTLLKVRRSGIIMALNPGRQNPPFMNPAKSVGRHLDAVFPADTAAALTEAVIAVLVTGEIQLLEFKLSPKIYIEARVVKADDDDALIIIRDISEWRLYEACDLLLLDITAKVQQEWPLEEIFSLVCERLTQIFRPELLWIVYKEPNSNMKYFTEKSKRVQDLPDRICNPVDESGLVGAVLRTGLFQLMSSKDPRLLSWREWLEERNITTAAAFPLKVDNKALGALVVLSADNDYWHRRIIMQLNSFIEQVASAIQAISNRQRLKLLTTGLESAANAIFITDHKGDIRWVNPAFLELSGYSRPEVLGKNIRTFKSGEHSRSFYKTMQQHISSGRIWYGETVNRRKDGSRYIAEMSITPVRDEKGEIANFIAIIQDVTQRKMNEIEMLEARESVSRAERLSSLGVMAAGIAHEINQPLNSLKVAADSMLYWYNKGRIPDIDEVMKIVGEISKDADRIDSIIKHMRSFIYNNELAVPEPCSLNEAVDESLKLLGMQLLSHNIQVSTALAAELPAVQGNCTQLEQIVINLLINAMHALDTVDRPGKEIQIATGCKQGRVFLRVSDNGPGVNRTIINKIFDPFFTTKSAGKGMGLGLTIVHSIVTAYGGRIRVKDNKPADGVTFWIDFPIAGRQEGRGLA